MKRVLFRMPTEKAFALNMLQGIAACMSQQESWQLIVPGERGWPRDIDIRAHPWDGMILPVIQHGTIDWLKQTGIPFVNVTAYPNLPTVRNDNEQMGRIAADHFLQQGYRHFVFFGNAHTFFSSQREAGFRKRLAEEGLPLITWMTDHLSPPQLQICLSRLPLPAVVQCVTDIEAKQIYDACQRADLRIPDQIAVSGMDDEVLALTLAPPLTSVQPDGWRVGYESAALLHALMHGHPPPERPLLIPPKGMAARASTAAFGYDDPAVVKALLFIRQHARRGLLVDRVAIEVGLSRRNLERRFHRAVGHTLWQEMRRVQVEHLKNLLLSSRLPIKAIASQSAFPNPVRLAQIFKAETGETPVEFRNRHRKLEFSAGGAPLRAL